MTTKELLRRLESYTSLDHAAYLFSSCELESDVPYVFRCVINGNVSYTLSYFLELPDDLVYCSVERFSRAVFNAQVKYFKSFFSRASKTQQEYICKSMLVNNLLALINAGSAYLSASVAADSQFAIESDSLPDSGTNSQSDLPF